MWLSILLSRIRRMLVKCFVRLWRRGTVSVLRTEQSYWDTWNKLSQGSGSVDEYNIAFQQALTNLGNEITDEQVKVERYRMGLQSELKEACRISPLGTRWANLNAIAE